MHSNPALLSLLNDNLDVSSPQHTVELTKVLELSEEKPSANVANSVVSSSSVSTTSTETFSTEKMILKGEYKEIL